MWGWVDIGLVGLGGSSWVGRAEADKRCTRYFGGRQGCFVEAADRCFGWMCHMMVLGVAVAGIGRKRVVVGDGMDTVRFASRRLRIEDVRNLERQRDRGTALASHSSVASGYLVVQRKTGHVDHSYHAGVSDIRDDRGV